MTTAADLIQDAAEKTGVYASTETVSGTDQTRLLAILNRMIDSWSNESLTCFEELEQSAPMVVGQFAYQIGIGAPDFNMTRPLRIKDGPGAAYMQDPTGNKYSVNVRVRDQWNLIANPTQVTANVPTDIFYDPQFPFGVINVFPIPNISWTLYWDSYLQLVTFAGPTTAVSLPPGYEKAIVDNLAMLSWRYFKPDAVQIPQDIVLDAMRSKGNVKRTNKRENVAVYDPEIIARGNGTYNIFSDRGS